MGINTNGWDTLYSIRFEEMNKSLAANGSKKAFSVTGDSNGAVPPAQGATSTFTVSGSIDPPLLTVGGGGNRVNLKIRINDPNYTKASGIGSPNQTSSVKQLTSPVDFVVQVSLVWVSLTQNSHLVTDAKGVQILDPIEYNDTNKPSTEKLTGAEKVFFKIALDSFFQSTPDFFQQLFAIANISLDSKPDSSFGWITPTSYGYAVSDDSEFDISNAVFGILCMTGNRPAPNSSQLPGNTIPVPIDPKSGQKSPNSSFVISQERLIENLILPLVPNLFQNAAEKDFKLEGNAISNQNELTLDTMELDNGTKVNPLVKPGDFTVTISDTLLNIELELEFEYSKGITVNMTNKSSSALALNEDRSQLKTAYLGGNTNVGVTVAPWVGITTAVTDLVTTVLMAAVAELVSAGMEANDSKGNSVSKDDSHEMSDLAEAMIQTDQNVGVFSEDRQTSVTRYAETMGYEPVDPQDPERTGFQRDPKFKKPFELPQDLTFETVASFRDQSIVCERGSTQDLRAGADEFSRKSKGYSTAIQNAFSRNRTMLVALITSALAGGLSGMVITILEGEAQSEIPTLNGLSEQIVSHIKWPGAKNQQLLSAQLNGGLQFGFFTQMEGGS